MKRIFLLGLSLMMALSALAQGPRVYRSEFVTFDKREDAVADKRSETANYTPFKPERIAIAGGEARFVQKINIDATLNDYNVFFHLENVGMAYTLFLNNEAIAEVDDPITPADFLLSPYLRQGVNELMVGVRMSRTPQLQENLVQPNFEQFENSYIFAQRRLSVRDFDVILEPDTTRQYAKLKLDVIVANDFNYKETIQVGFDIYDPKGKLKEYSVNEIELEGRSMDTLRFNPDVYHSYNFKWGDGKTPLYDVMLYVKRNGMLWEYIPMKIGFTEYGYTEQGEITAFGTPLKLSKATYNAASDRATTEREIKALKAKGVNCLCPDYPQPRWFYDVCDRIGIYVIDCMAISSPTAHEDRNMGGTPANAPWLVEEYVSRAKAMYSRTRNHACIIAFSLSNTTSGNGYNMYKAYEALKATGDSRAIIYPAADGEWNSDI